MSNVAEVAVITKLLATTAVTNIVGQRVYPWAAPQGNDGGKKPYVIIMRPEGQVNTQVSTGRFPVSFTPIIVACVGETYHQSRTLSEPVMDALNPSDWTGSQLWGETEVAACQVDDTFDRSVLSQLADEIGSPVEFHVFNLNHAS